MSAKTRHRRRLSIFEGQRGLCCICGELMTLERPHCIPPPPPDFATFEHVIPRSEGGTWDWSNIKLSHYRCNRARSVGTTHAPLPAVTC